MTALHRILITLAAGIAAGACATTPQAAPRSTGTSPTSSTTSTMPATAAVAAAVQQDLAGQGVPSSNFEVTVAVSPVDPSWASFTTRATPAAKASFQGGYGFAHRSTSGWKVAASGSAFVGCNQNPGLGVIGVPRSVIAAAGYRCP